jgi:thioredoxin reductase (NADPH)
VDRLLAKVAEGKAEIRWNTTVQEVTGDDSGVQGLSLRCAAAAAPARWR